MTKYIENISFMYMQAIPTTFRTLEMNSKQRYKICICEFQIELEFGSVGF